MFIGAALHPARADDFVARCADRASSERVYHTHRLGTQQPFEQAMPRSLLKQIVRQDHHKEEVLRKVYGMEITPALVAAEVERINTTTRAPEVLTEIKTALGNDAARFATAMPGPSSWSANCAGVLTLDWPHSPILEVRRLGLLQCAKKGGPNSHRAFRFNAEPNSFARKPSFSGCE